MSKGPWKKKAPESPATPNGAVASPPLGVPLNKTDKPPLPLLSPLSPLKTDPPAPTASPITNKAPELASGLGKGFKSICNAIPHWLPVEMEEVSDEEGELWGTCALPVLEKYIPNFKDTPEYMLLGVTLLIVGGKIRRKKVVANVGTEGNRGEGRKGNPGDSSASGVVPGM